MITGEVGLDRQVRVHLPVNGRHWPAVIDTGFNGDLELPYQLGEAVEAVFWGTVRSRLADGREVIEESYRVRFPFDGEHVTAEATFAPVEEILIGTRLLRRHRLEISFPRRQVYIERE